MVSMPFTPFHLGPAVCLGVPLRNYFHAPTFILANIIIDIEPLIVLTAGLNYPLHGYFHTFLAAVFVGIAFGLVMFFLEKHMHPLYSALQLEQEVKSNKAKFVVAGILGTTLHVLFDSPLYSDIKPFYPLNANPLYGLVSSSEILLVCVWMGVLGVTFYALLLFRVYKRLQTRQREVK
jgi:hypothetical protein